MGNMDAIGFDLGDTLIHYKNIPNGSFQEHFKAALWVVANELELVLDEEWIVEGEVILTKYNTRIFPRDHEVKDFDIFGEILDSWGVDQTNVDLAVRSFFNYFQKGSELYEDTLTILKKLKEKHVRIGVLTDVPYGLNKELVLKDIEPFHAYIDEVITSVDVGWRKPRPEGYLLLAKRLGVSPDQLIYVGNEWKDITGANRSGLKSILINRDGAERKWEQQGTIRNLSELLQLLT